MTAYEIINTAFGLAGEYLDMYPDKNLTVTWLNITLAECADAQKVLAQKENRSFQEIITPVQQLSDTVDISPQLAQLAVPYGVAAHLMTDRADGYMAAVFRNRFINGLQECAKGQESSIVDIYGGGR